MQNGLNKIKATCLNQISLRFGFKVGVVINGELIHMNNTLAFFKLVFTLGLLKSLLLRRN